MCVCVCVCVCVRLRGRAAAVSPIIGEMPIKLISIGQWFSNGTKNIAQTTLAACFCLPCAPRGCELLLDDGDGARMGLV